MFYRAKFQPGDKFIYGIFGIQSSHQHPTSRQNELINVFDTLITYRAHHDRVVVHGSEGLVTKIWLSYWRPESFAKWWDSADVKSFWNGLPDDAGVWREILTVSSGRHQNACSAEANNGVCGLGDTEPFSDNIGYWGCYRHRKADTKSGNQFASALDVVPERNTKTGAIRSGRISVADIPNNVCFVVEGQDHSQMSSAEKDLWFEEFDDLVTGWMDHLVEDAAANGIFDGRMGYVPDSGKFQATGPPNLYHNRKIQMFYWIDMGQFERVGRMHNGHVKLRRKWMDNYGPQGLMGSGKGDITLWEETSILKDGDVIAEYIGCREDTGFLAYENRSDIKS